MSITEPTIEDQVAFYDRWNLLHRKGRFDEIDPEIRRRGQEVLRYLRASSLDNPKILEVGCGTGWLTERLCELSDRVTAVDLSPGAIEIASRRGLTAEFVCGDFYEQEFAANSFDVVVCVETLFYVPDQHVFVERLAHLLRPSGLLIATTINKFVYDRRRGIRPPEPGQIRSWLTPKEVRELLSRHLQVLSTVSVQPRGRRGLLRLVNSYKVNELLGRVFTPTAVKRAKENLGLGSGVIFLARKEPATP